VGVSLIKHVGGYPTVYGLVPLFDLNGEQNVPTYFNASLHLFSSALLAVIAVLKKQSSDRYTRQWAVLCGGFLFMAFDEAAGLHELMGRPMEELLGDRATGVLHFAWVLPGIVIVAFFALWFLRFLLHLPLRTRLLVVAAGAMFIGGAVGVELFEGRHAAAHGSANIAFDLYVLAEETLEMSGLTVFIYAMLRYIEHSYGAVQFRVRGSPEGTAYAAPEGVQPEPRASRAA
jgi:hypothetical protein